MNANPSQTPSMQAQCLRDAWSTERAHRDSAIYTIFEGTSEIQRLVIARAISGTPIR